MIDEVRKSIAKKKKKIRMMPDESKMAIMKLLSNSDVDTIQKFKNSKAPISTVKSIGINVDGKKVLIPIIDEDGNTLSDKEAIQMYKKTGKHIEIESDSRDEAQELPKELKGREGFISDVVNMFKKISGE